MESVFVYGERELTHLRHCDVRMAGLIERFGMIRREVIPDLFVALVSNIVGQQVSGKAAATIFGRLMREVQELMPQRLLSIDPERMRRCGLSPRKVHYIRSAAAAIEEGQLPVQQLPGLSDEEVKRVLVALPGVGEWTAEMLMIFSLQRPNVLSRNDLVIRRSLLSLYDLPKLTREQFEIFRARFSPYCTVASFYLWAYGNALSKEEIARIGK